MVGRGGRLVAVVGVGLVAVVVVLVVVAEKKMAVLCDKENTRWRANTAFLSQDDASRHPQAAPNTS